MDGITQENAIHVLSLSFTNISSNAGSAYYCQLLKLHNVVFQFCNQPSTMSVAEAMAYSEQPAMKCVGITIETHPDYCLKPHLQEILSYDCMRIGLAWSIYESVAQETNRGNTIAAVCNSFHLAKDCGFKVVFHLMLDLPNTVYWTQFGGHAGILKSRLSQRWH